MGNPGLLGVEGITRDSVGSTILAFLGPLGACFINEADLEALRISLREACRSAYLWKRGIRHVQLGEPSVCVQLRGRQQVVEEVLDLAKTLEEFFVHVKLIPQQISWRMKEFPFRVCGLIIIASIVDRFCICYPRSSIDMVLIFFMHWGVGLWILSGVDW